MAGELAFLGSRSVVVAWYFVTFNERRQKEIEIVSIFRLHQIDPVYYIFIYNSIAM